MYVKRVIDPEIIFFFSWRPVLWTTALSSVVYALYYFGHLKMLAIPFLPIATVGTAVAFYVGFKNNSSYDRLWEARKIWGEITNTSRSLCAYLLAVVKTPEGKREAKVFVYRHIAFVNILRAQLRRRNVWDEKYIYTRMARECFNTKPFEQDRDDILKEFCSTEDADLIRLKGNGAKEIVALQMKMLTQFKRNEWIDAYEHSDLMRICADLYVHQGKAERIKVFPFPRQYAYFSEVFVHIFMILLPFGLIGEFVKIDEGVAWLTIPFSVLISFVFLTMEAVGDSSENPFEGSLNDVPMSAICRNIEIDLKELLEENDLPAPLEAVDSILM